MFTGLWNTVIATPRNVHAWIDFSCFAKIVSHNTMRVANSFIMLGTEYVSC